MQVLRRFLISRFLHSEFIGRLSTRIYPSVGYSKVIGGRRNDKCEQVAAGQAAVALLLFRSLRSSCVGFGRCRARLPVLLRSIKK